MEGGSIAIKKRALFGSLFLPWALLCLKLIVGSLSHSDDILYFMEVVK